MIYTAYRTYTVYSGSIKGKIVYIGTTTQEPKERFRWHTYNGKDLNFKILHQCNNADEMFDKEFELIKKYNPRLNKIKHRKQNFNIKLSVAELENRKGDPQWCQYCLKRHVSSKKYKYCYWCSKAK